MQFITAANRHPTFLTTLQALEAADNPSRPVDAFASAGNAKKPMPPASRVTTRCYKKVRKKRGPLLPFETTALANIFGGKVCRAVPRRLFQKTGLKV
jgi:hypothetical protein